MRPPRPTLSIALLSLSFVSVQATADDESSEPVVVSATRVPTPESQIASSVTLITAEDIARKQEQTLPQVLKDVPGLNLVQSGGPGSLTSVFMRGTNANHTKVFIDGIDVSDPSNSNTNFDFGQLLTQDISRVEVLRGPQSGLYGSDAIGGVINIVTREGNGPARLTGSLSGGSFGTFNQTAGVSGSSSALHYSAGLEHYHSSSTPVTPLGLLLPGEERHDEKAGAQLHADDNTAGRGPALREAGLTREFATDTRRPPSDTGARARPTAASCSASAGASSRTASGRLSRCRDRPRGTRRGGSVETSGTSRRTIGRSPSRP